MNKTKDIRAELQATASGKERELPANAIDQRVVRENQSAFRAWARFGHSRRTSGEMLAAPATILTPLP